MIFLQRSAISLHPMPAHRSRVPPTRQAVPAVLHSEQGTLRRGGTHLPRQVLHGPGRAGSLSPPGIGALGKAQTLGQQRIGSQVVGQSRLPGRQRLPLIGTWPGMMSPQRASRSAGAGTILVSGAVTTAVELMYVSSVLGLIHAMPATAPVRALQADEFQDYRAPLTSLGESLHTSAPRRGAANSTWWTPFSGQLKWGKGFFAREGGEALH